MNYELKTEQFSGPIEKLWELIEEKKLEITELNLAEVTADFLNYLKTIEKVEPKLLADFVVIASRLLLIKSKALLPNLELTVEEEKLLIQIVWLLSYDNRNPCSDMSCCNGISKIGGWSP